MFVVGALPTSLAFWLKAQQHQHNTISSTADLDELLRSIAEDVDSAARKKCTIGDHYGRSRVSRKTIRDVFVAFRREGRTSPHLPY